MKIPSIFIILASLALCTAQGQVPSILNYQGRVTVGGTNFNGTGQFRFALVNGDGTAVYWKNDGTTTTNEPSNAVSVAVAQGLYSTLLGDTTLSNMAALPSTVFSNANVNLRTWFSAGGTNAFVKLSPDQRLGSSGYALRAAAADSAVVTNIPGNLTVSGILTASQLIGGYSNTASGSYATIGGGERNTAGTNWATVGGGILNEATDESATVGGGAGNTASGYSAAVGAGEGNTASGNYATIPGGRGNNASGNYAAVGGGGMNLASGYSATVGAGEGNTASGDYSMVGGGQFNAASDIYTTVGGGLDNAASGDFATVPGGWQNTATNYAFAAGRRAKATNDGAFVWADSTDANFGSTGSNQFLVRAAGGLGINTNNPGTNALSVAGGASISGNLNVGSINGRTNFSSYATTFSFLQNNGTPYQILATGTNVVATFVQRPGVAVTSCSIAYSLTGVAAGTVNFYDVTGLTAGTIGSNNLIPGGAQTFTAGVSGTNQCFELGGLNISSPAASPRIVQIVINASSGGSSSIRLYAIAIGFTPN